MKKLIVLIVGMSISMACYTQKVQSGWESNQIHIDGFKKDWSQQPRLSDYKTGILYGVTNNDENLYLFFEFPDEKLQMKVMRAGFDIDIQVKTKPKLKASIEFPVMEKPRREQEKSMGDRSDRANRGDGNMKAKKENNANPYLMQANFAQIDGFLKSSDLISRNKANNLPFTFDIAWKANNNMLLELVIPFSEIFPEATSKEEILASVIKIKPTLNGIEQAAGAGQGSRSGGMGGPGGSGGGMSGRGGGGGGMGGQGGGGMGGRGGGMGGGPSGSSSAGNSSDMQWMFSDQSFSLKVQLNTNSVQNEK